MRSLYAQIALIVVLSAILSATLGRFVLPLVDPHSPPDPTRAVLHRGLTLARTDLERAAVDDYPRVLAAIAPHFDYPLRVMTRVETDRVVGEELSRDAPTARELELYLPLAGGAHYLVAGPLSPPDRPAARLIFPLFLMLSIAGLSALLIAGPLTRRLRRLQRATLELEAGDLSVRVEDDSRDVVGQLATAFNSMAARIQAHFVERDRLMQAISHEFATPLARMRFHIEALEDATSDRGRQRPLEAIDEELGEVDRLCRELASWVDADGRRPDRETIDIVRELERMAARAAEHGRSEITIAVLEAEVGLAVLADERHFRRALENVLRNAVRYAHGCVTLAARSDGEHVQIEIGDDGPGIPAESRVRVFEPFARLDPSRSREEGGMGLGLAITQRILFAHGGSVRIDASPKGGALLVMRWPRALG